MAVMKKQPAVKVDAVKPLLKHTFRGLSYHSWNLTDDPNKSRLFATVVLKFGEISQWVDITEFKLSNKNGFQRHEVKAWSSQLREQMEHDSYTPTGWGMAITQEHFENLIVWDNANGRLDLTVTSEAKLALTDGGHRYRAMRQLLNAADKGEDSDLKERILNLPITITISLNPDRIHEDFLNMNKGKAVSRNLTESMKILGNFGGKDGPLQRHASDTVKKLNENKDSHLANNVTFDQVVGSMMQYATLISTAGSALATNITGGSKIAMAYEKRHGWLVDRQVEAYGAIQKFGEAMDGGDDPHQVRKVFGPGMPLTPLKEGGRRGGSHLLIGIGNLWAWRFAQRKSAEVFEEDLRRIAESATKVFDVDPEETPFGGSATEKRELMGAYAAEYFNDMDVPKVRGVPVGLLEIISPGNFGPAVQQEWALTNGKKSKKKEAVK